MNTITHSQRYLPHEINTKFYAVKLYRSGVGVSFVCRRYHISKSSLLRWNKKFDGTKESLLDKSHRPLSKHPNAHTDEELRGILSMSSSSFKCQEKTGCAALPYPEIVA